MTHPRALSYLGDTSDATNSMQTWARVARSGSQVTIVNGGITYEDGRQTIGINKTDLDFSPSSLGLRGRMGLKTSGVRSPERLIAFAEACDWMVTWDDVGRWEPAFDQGGSVQTYVDAPAFRAGGRLLVVCYAGNVMRLTLEEAREVDRWSIF